MENPQNSNHHPNPSISQLTRFHVAIRIRPELGDERNELTTDEDLTQCVAKITEKQINLSKNPNEEIRIFEFDHILGVSITQEECYNSIASKIVADVIEGYNGTIMAYGQTGSGKTYTIFGKKQSMDYQDTIDPDMGIVPRAIKQLFRSIQEKSDKIQFQVRVAFMQVYMEQITDLIPDEEDALEKNIFAKDSVTNFSVGKKKDSYLLKNGLQIREDPNTGIFVKGLKQIRVNSEEELLELIKYGSKFRITSETSMNKTSSRSHAVLQILIEQKWMEREIFNDSTQAEGSKLNQIKKRHYKKGLLSIIDLAGSERISKSGIQGLNQEEAKKINVSISTLGNVINALANNTDTKHVPYRDSKLTRILTECLGGNSKTAICACVSPFLMNYDETQTTLQFASRAIRIKINAKINEKVEMKKIKDKLNDFIKIKNIESLIKEKNKLEEDANELKNTVASFKKEINKARSRDALSRSINNDQENRIERSKSNPKGEIKNGNKNFQSTGQFGASESSGGGSNNHDSYANITQKFHAIIIHLQTELAKSVVTIHSLEEENLQLKEQLRNLTKLK